MTPNELYDIIRMEIVSREGEVYDDAACAYVNPEDTRWVLNVILKGYTDIDVEDGASKVCIIPIEGDFVFKITREDRSTEESCETEAMNYRQAKANGLDKFFLKTQLYKHFNECGFDFDIYIQPKIDLISMDVDEERDEELEESESLDSYKGYGSCSEDLSLAWIENFLNYYGERSYDELILFCDCNLINDLHSGNVGYVFDDDHDPRPVIFDYAGYGNS